MSHCAAPLACPESCACAAEVREELAGLGQEATRG